MLPETITIEDLSSESKSDSEETIITFKDLFNDHNASVRPRRNIIIEESLDGDTFELNMEGADIDKIWDFDSLKLGQINLTDFESDSTNLIRDDIDEVPIFVNDKEVKELPKIGPKSFRRQSTRIENQTRKKIADQIQRENVRLALEAQLLNNVNKSSKTDMIIINGKPASPATQRYMSLPTDLDAEDEDAFAELIDDDSKSDNPDDKLWCVCRQPQGTRLMVCCDNCLEWFHSDCVGVPTKSARTKNKDFTCPSCIVDREPSKDHDEVLLIDESGDGDQSNVDDDDCLITSAEGPVKFNLNIFQLIGTKDHSEEADVTTNGTGQDSPETSPSPSSSSPLLAENGKSPCLNVDCRNLVDPSTSLYCSKDCIDLYTKMVIKDNHLAKSKEYGLPTGPKLAKMTRFVLAQPATEIIQDEFAAPTEDTLNEFLVENPTFKVYQSKKPDKVKPDPEKVDKFTELLNNDPTKHIKMVKHFATLFKKSMSLKAFNAEFNAIWQLCIKIEDGVFEACDKSMDESYSSKIKEISEYMQPGCETDICDLVLHKKISVSDLISKNKEELEGLSNVIVVEDDPEPMTSTKSNAEKKDPVINKQPGLSLLADTTHLHGQHLYDIKCKVCNGSQKSDLDNKIKEQESVATAEKTVLLPTEVSEPVKPQISTNNTNNCPNSPKTPELVIDLDSCPPTPVKRVQEQPIDNNTTSNKENALSNIKPNIQKPYTEQFMSLWEGKLTYNDIGTVKCNWYLITRYFMDKYVGEQVSPLMYDSEQFYQKINVSASIGKHVKINGRSKLKVVDEYLQKLRKHSDKEVLVFRLHPLNSNDGQAIYRSMFEFFFTRERCGVISDKDINVKECFIYPLNAHAMIPQIFRPLIGPGLDKQRPHLLLMIIVRTPLVKLPYKPISPKYDHDHEFLKKHGVNLEKYCQHSSNSTVIPFPVGNSGDAASRVIEATADRNVNKDDNIKDKQDDNSVNNVPIRNDASSDSIRKFANVTQLRETSELVVKSPQTTDGAGNLIDNHSENHTEKASTEIIATKSDPKIATALFLQKFADIVMHGPRKDETDQSFSKTIIDIISESKSLDVEIFEKMADIVMSAEKREISQKSPVVETTTKNNNLTTDYPWHDVPVSSDPSLKPRPFFYKSKALTKTDSPIISRNNMEIRERFCTSSKKRNYDISEEITMSQPLTDEIIQKKPRDEEIYPKRPYDNVSMQNKPQDEEAYLNRPFGNEIIERRPLNADIYLKRPFGNEIIERKPQDECMYLKRPFGNESIQKKKQDEETSLQRPFDNEIKQKKPEDEEVYLKRHFRNEIQQKKPEDEEVYLKRPFGNEIIQRKPQDEEAYLKRPFGSEFLQKKLHGDEIKRMYGDKNLVQKPQDEDIITKRMYGETPSQKRFQSEKISRDSLENNDTIPLLRIEPEQVIVRDCQNLYLKRKHSSRLYTFYDSFASDENAQEKRQNYFFNPFSEKARPDIAPVHRFNQGARIRRENLFKSGSLSNDR